MTPRLGQIRASQVEGGAFDVYGARRARACAARFMARSLARFRAWGLMLLRVRQIASNTPTEGSSFLDRDEVAAARRVLLG
jgi:hypothetical protein